MIKLDLAEIAVDAAYDLDMLRLGKPDRRRGIERLLEAVRSAFPRDGNVANGQIAPRNVVLLNEVLERVSPTQRHRVSDVVRDVNVWLDELDEAWRARRYEQRFVNFLLMLSKVTSARCGREGHTIMV